MTAFMRSHCGKDGSVRRRRYAQHDAKSACLVWVVVDVHHHGLPVFADGILALELRDVSQRDQAWDAAWRGLPFARSRLEQRLAVHEQQVVQHSHLCARTEAVMMSGARGAHVTRRTETCELRMLPCEGYHIISLNTCQRRRA